MEAEGWHGRSPLHLAALHGHASTVEVLLRNGASMEVKDRGNCTPLHYAACRGHTRTVELLLRQGSLVGTT